MYLNKNSPLIGVCVYLGVPFLDLLNWPYILPKPNLWSFQILTKLKPWILP